MEQLTAGTYTGTEWTVWSWYQTTDGDRVALWRDPARTRWALVYTYAPTDLPQLITFESNKDALVTYGRSLAKARTEGRLAYVLDGDDQ